MLEHSAMYLNVTPPYEEDNTTFFPDFYTTRLVPCDLQDPVWGKMNSLTAAVNKKRKKSETKPQAQINKCNNEKRRREQENIYIEELAELISANFADMSSLSVKPDKCAILQEAVNQIRTIKQQESVSTDPVQQGEVSSSRPTILSNEVYGPLLLEALEGFLFVINGEGKVEHLTDNISTYIKFTKEDVLGKSIYNFIHHGDHAKFHSNLHPMTIEWGANPNNPNNEQLISNNNKSKSIDIRLLIKPPDDLDETIEEKQQRISSYELMHISSTQLRDSITDGTQQRDNSGPFMLCVASRISQRTACTIEQFTTKLDANAFKVICVDTSGLSDAVALYIRRELKNRGLRDLVPQQEVHKVTAHLRETVNCGQSTSAIYRLQIGPDKLVQVQTKSKLFRTNPGSREDSDFIMATHSIIGDNELSGGNSDPASTGSGTNAASSGVGGPLMPSVVNGNRIPSSEDTILTSTNTTFNTFHLDNEYFDIFPSSTWELDSSNWQQQQSQQQQQQQQQENRPDSTPTPNSSSYSANSPNVATIVQSSSFTTTTTTPVTSNAYYFNSLSTDGAANANFRGLDERDDNKVNIMDESNNKLRILLTKPQNVNNVNNNDGDDKNKDRILKELLNQQDEDGMRSDNRGSPRGLLGRSGSLPGTSDQSKSASPGTGNDMLRKLLNDKSDDDDLESRSVGMKKKSELLQQLLKLEREPDDDKKNEHSSTDDTLMRSLGFPSSPTDRTRKRSIEDKDDNTLSSKRTAEGPQVSSSGASMGNSLRERNKMLASLLEKNPSNHQPIPPIPASVISATPQEKLPRISDPNKTIQMGMNQNTRMPVNRMAGRPSQQTTNYLNVLSNNNNNTNNNINSRRIGSNVFLSSAPSSSTDNQNQIWEPGSADPLLSELLDQVIDFVPDEIMHLLDGAEGQQNTNYALSEAVAINNIQKSLMQCEGAVKSPGSPIGTPPAYSAANLSNQNNQGSVFPPPPNYSQAKFQRMQIRSAGGTTQQFAANLQLQQRKQLIYQEQQKRRLLLQQKQQHLLIPSNAANNEISNNINSIQSIDSLLNNTVAPNVSLQRSSSVPNESQLSPPYGQTGRLSSQQQQQQQQQAAQQQQQQQQQPYSPHSQLTSPVYPQTTSYQGSAQSPAQAQFNAQLSPRQAYPQNSNSWQQQQARMGVQQNTMLSAQLTRPPQQQQRSINSPGAVTSRHSPYPTNEQFSSPNSPNSPFNSQYLRLPRANSVPSATTQLPGGLSSPRPYTSRDHHPHLYPPVPHPHSVPPMMGYQQDSPQYCYDQTGLPLAYNGGPERGRAPPPHLQPGVSGSAPTSEFVRQELRAVVGARTAHAQPGANAPPNRPPSQLHQQQVNDLETLGLHFEMASGASESPKLWGEMGSMSPQPVNSRSTMEEGRQGDQKSSLLQKLLSE